MISPLVNPLAGYSTLSRLDSSSSCSPTRTRTTVRSFIDDLVGSLVVAQPQEAREPQPQIGRALGEFQLDHHLRPYPDGTARILAGQVRHEWRGRLPQRGKRRQK